MKVRTIIDVEREAAKERHIASDRIECLINTVAVRTLA